MTAAATTPADLKRMLLSGDPADRARAAAEIERIVTTSPEVNTGFELPAEKRVVRYDSSLHSESDLAAMTSFVRARVADMRRRNPTGRLVLTQNKPFPGDGPAELRALLAAQVVSGR